MTNHPGHGPSRSPNGTDTGRREPWYRTWAGITALGALAGVTVYLSLYHVTHVLDALPFVLLLACPLMHLFMHGGHGHGGHGGKEGTGRSVSNKDPDP